MNEHSFNWSALVFGSFSRDEVLPAVKDIHWQRVRVSLLGTPLRTKFETLRDYVSDDYVVDGALDVSIRRIQVTNYVHALSRGGLISPVR